MRLQLVYVLLLLFASMAAGAQQITITGTVADPSGSPVSGATLSVKGGTATTATDAEGKFTLSGAASDGVLEITHVNFKPREEPINGRTIINITLEAAQGSMDEVVVVGYGQQKKVNLTGSVSSVNVADVTQGRPITNLSRGLAGLAPGVYVNSAGNRPSNDNASILVRGQGTLNNAAPFVVIDGVEGNINMVNPEDIENISILKDAASSSIYGSRAANGVILITTKKGKAGRLQFNYNGFLAMESVGNTIEPVSNYANYMELVNEGLRNGGQREPFSKTTIDTWRQNEGKDELKYPNTDWRKEVFRTSPATTHNISATGGSEKISFFTSFRYNNNPGIMENTGVKRYDLRTNLEARIKEWFTLGTNLNGSIANIGPASFDLTGTTGLDNVFTFTGASSPGMVLRSPDGRYGVGNSNEENPQLNNVLANLNISTGQDKRYTANTRFYTILRPFKGFTINSSYNYRMETERIWSKPVFLDRWNFLTNTIATVGTGRTNIYNFSSQTERHFMDVLGTYDITLFGNLNTRLMAGASQEQLLYQDFGARRFDLIDPSLTVINAAIGEASATGNAYDWAMRSYFGRLNLNWDEKYLAEFNVRADGSSRFLPETRWGYFPSASIGWRIDREKFMNNIIDKGMLSALKLRASYGSLGNNAVGNYDALSVYSLSNYVLNSTLQQGLSQRAIANAALSWEKTIISNIGVDAAFLNNRLSATIEAFNKTTKDILIDLPAPLVRGTATIPKQNSATLVNKGVEIDLEWRDKIGQNFSYFARANFSYIKNEVTKFKGEAYSIINNGLIKEGEPVQIQFLRAFDRIVQTDEDLAIVQRFIDNAPLDPATGQKRNPFPYGVPQKGDILYKDLTGDGIINDDDRTTYGNGSNPKYIYGLSLGAEYKGFDLSALLQGVAGIQMYYNDLYYNSSVRWGYQINKAVADGRWYEGRTTPAEYPRLLDYANTKNNLPSNFWLTNKSYLKIRNIQLGYTVPKPWMAKAGMSTARIYASLENFFTFTKYPGIDPEVEGTNYPTMRQVVFGLNFTF